MRGLAALDVTVGHLGDFIMAKYPSLNYVVVFNWFSLDIFFCLSALTLCLVYGPGIEKSLNVSKFFVARFARVYPLAILGLLLTGPYFSMWDDMSSPNGRETIFLGIRQLLLINHWPIVSSGPEWLGPLWSLSDEVFLYIFIFPILFYMAKSAGRMPANKIMAGIVVVMILRIFFMKNDGPGEMQYSIILAGAVAMFVAGWLMYLLYAFHPAQWTVLTKTTDFIWFVIIAVLIANGCGRVFNINSLVVVGSYAEVMILLVPFLIGGLMREDTAASRFLSSRPIYFLGQISYSLYVLHVVTRPYIDHYYVYTLHNDRDGFCFLLTMAGSLLAATVSYFWFECPVRNFIRRRFLGRREEIAATSV